MNQADPNPFSRSNIESVAVSNTGERRSESPLPGVLAEFRARVRIADLLALAIPAVAIVLVFLAPDRVKQAYVLTPTNPSPVTVFTSHFVHLTRSHLVDNLLAYLVLAPTGYALSLLGRQRSAFMIAFVTYVLALPIALSVFSLPLLPRGDIVGFSGIAMAFAGLLPVMLFQYLDERFRGPFNFAQAPGLFFPGIALVSITSVPNGRGRFLLCGIALVVFAAYLGRPLASVLTRERALVESVRGYTGHIELIGFSLAAYGGVLFASFPLGTTPSEGVTIYFHLLGFTLGFLSAFLLLWVWRAL